jgi:hypothetical protein
VHLQCVYMYVHKNIYIYTFMSIFWSTNTYANIYVCVFVYLCVYVYVGHLHRMADICTLMVLICTEYICMNRYINMWLDKDIYAYICVHIYVYVHV